MGAGGRERHGRGAEGTEFSHGKQPPSSQTLFDADEDQRIVYFVDSSVIQSWDVVASYDSSLGQREKQRPETDIRGRNPGVGGSS